MSAADEERQQAAFRRWHPVCDAFAALTPRAKAEAQRKTSADIQDIGRRLATGSLNPTPDERMARIGASLSPKWARLLFASFNPAGSPKERVLDSAAANLPCRNP